MMAAVKKTMGKKAVVVKNIATQKSTNKKTMVKKPTVKNEKDQKTLVVPPIFGKLKYDDDYRAYKTKTTLKVLDKEVKVDLIISELFGVGGIEEAHCEAYNAFMENVNKIMQDVFQGIIKYQNNEWDSTDHSASFPMFKTIDDVIKNTKIISITLKIHPEKYGSFRGQRGRFIVLIFNAKWVNDDYGLLSVALINEKVVEVTDQNI